MNAQIFFQDPGDVGKPFPVASPVTALQPLSPAQSRGSLFAFKDCSRPNLFPVRPVGRQVRAKSTTRQLHFEGADGIAAGLRPEQSQAF